MQSSQVEELEKNYNKKIYTILQLRLHPTIKKLKKEIEKSEKFYKVKLDYITPKEDGMIFHGKVILINLEVYCLT